jgi:hypothetical protein
MTIASRLVGVWKLASYTVDGFVSAQLVKPGRSLFQSHDWNGGTADEYQQAGSGYIAYCGVYEVDEEKETVTHIPSVALVPNLILKGQLRSRAVVPVANGVSVTSRLEWQRARAKS